MAYFETSDPLALSWKSRKCRRPVPRWTTSKPRLPIARGHRSAFAIAAWSHQTWKDFIIGFCERRSLPKIKCGTTLFFDGSKGAAQNQYVTAHFWKDFILSVQEMYP